MSGGFPGSLVNTNLDAAAQALAAGLRDASLKLINTSLLAGGQVRFDLPTEPGYTYTIQFTQNPANPAGVSDDLQQPGHHGVVVVYQYTELECEGGVLSGIA